MQIYQVEKEAKKLFRKYKLYGWKLEFHNSMFNTFGLCYHYERIISLSGPLVLANSKKTVINVLLHEIAHAITGPEYADHGKKWLENCKKIGCTWPAFYREKDIIRPYKYYVSCPTCKTTSGYNRKTNNNTCKNCSSTLSWTPTIYLHWNINNFSKA